MKTLLTKLIMIVPFVIGVLSVPFAHASEVSPEPIFINSGTVNNDLLFHPPELTLKEGVLYKFVISNPSNHKHVVAAPELAASSRTTELMKVSPRISYSDASSSLAKGIPLQPGEMLEWTFTPTKEGTYKFGCNKSSHAAAGMHSMVTVRAEL
ncbi:MAG: plastocyanin/azurin family copper-binding protein [Gammaproteobacteria bacterium]|nr:plastocyanin/azurin family copper-binding protein [Gammaproteobacteria bacterium]MDH3406802.1 plastocyanin/azurin family copper-binding protein [Gammaproteobacteria bacterium]